MAKRVLYIVALLVLVTAGIIAVLKMGYEPQPVSIMKPSYFDKPEEIGAVVYRRFYSPIEQQKIVLFGVPPQPEFHRAILRGFMLAAAIEKHPFDVLLSESQMPPLDLNGIPPLESVAIEVNTQTEADFIERLKALKASGKRTLVYLPSVFSTHLLPGNPVQRYEQSTHEHLLSITSGPIALRPDQEFIVDPVCVGEQVDGTGLAPLGCAEMKAGRGLYRRKIKQERWVAIMNEQKPEDYLLLVSTPGQDKAEPPLPTPPAKPPGI